MCVVRSLVVAAIAAAVACPCGGNIAHANVLDDIGDAVGYITLIKPALNTVGNWLGGSAGEAFRSQMDGYIRQEVDPLLQEANAIIKGNLMFAAGEMLKLLKETEASCHRLLDQGRSITLEAIHEARAAGQQFLDQIRTILQDTLCPIVDRRGIVIVLPVLGSVNTIRISRPARTHCYRNFPEAQGDPAVAEFGGWEYYAGEVCEAELALAEIDPTDRHSVEKVANAYGQIAALARDAFCRMPGTAKKTEMMTKWHHAELEADFFTRLPHRSQRAL